MITKLSIRHRIVCNMPLKHLMFLIKNNCLHEYVEDIESMDYVRKRIYNI